MKKKIFCLILTAAILLSAVAMNSCGSKSEVPAGGTTRITFDVNPSVELIVDGNDKVVSVTALNDDGSILIAGEAIVGKTAEEAAELLVTLSVETGYLSEGNENTVKISVSGSDEYAKYLDEQVKASIESVMTELDIDGEIEEIAALGKESIKELVVATTDYTEEEVEAMSDEALYNALAEGRIETALLITEDMREAYYSAKEYEISFAEREETAKIIEAMGGLHALAGKTYSGIVELYSQTVDAIDDLRYELLVSPDSAYQKSLTALREAKTDLLKQRNYTAKLDINGEEYASATVTLGISEEAYDKALKLYEELGDAANEAIEKLVKTLRGYEETLVEFEKNFSTDIKEELSAKAVEIEKAVNAHKDTFFEKFEEAHADDIAKIENELIARKQALKASAAQ